MISRKAKARFYFVMGVPMRVNGVVYRALWAPRTGNGSFVKVHLGPGQKNYLTNWINVDANFVTAKCDVWANLEHPLPFRENSVDVFYSHHVIEHLPDSMLVEHFRQMFHCLKPGGMIRAGGPNGDMAVRKYLEGDASWFGNFPDHHESIGGKLKNFIFCRNEHQTILTPSYLKEVAMAAGFERLTICIPGKTTTNPRAITKDILATEAWSSPIEPHTLLVECYKPVTEDR
jgi:predicted SAM-dependent methyltransferase